MEDFKYASKEHRPLLYNIFHMITGKVKPIHQGPVKTFTRQTQVSMSVQDLKVFINTIRNNYDAHLFRHKVVYPEALNNEKTMEMERYS